MAIDLVRPVPGRLRRVRTAATALITAAALFLAACGGDGDPGSDASGDNATSDAGAVFRFAAENAVNSLDPQLVTATTYAYYWYGPAYETLVRSLSDGTYKPQLATEWAMAPDFLSLTFTLREQVKFHDGAMFDATAAKASLDRGKTLKGSNVASKLTNVSAFEAPDAKTLVVRFAKPQAENGILSILSDRGTEMISPNALSKTDLGVAPVGTGAYQIVSYNPGNKAVYKRFDGWWNGTPKLAGVEVTTVTDRNAAYNGLQSGQFDMVPMPAEQVEAAKSDPSLEVLEIQAPQIYQVLVNIDRKFKDLRVRQAFSHAIDREAFASVTGSKATPTQQEATPGNAAYDESIQGYAYDPAKAKQLLAEAGYPNGLSFRLNFSARPEQQTQAEALQEMLKASGFDMTIEATEAATTVQKCNIDKQCDALLGNFTLNLDFLSNFNTYGTPRYVNTGSVPEFLAVVEAAKKITDSKLRVEEAKKVNAAVTQYIPELIPIVSTRFQYATTKKVVGGFDFNSVQQSPYWDTVSMSS